MAFENTQLLVMTKEITIAAVSGCSDFPEEEHGKNVAAFMGQIHNKLKELNNNNNN